MKRRFRVVASTEDTDRHIVYAANEDEFADFTDLDDIDDVSEQLQDVSDTVEDIQDDLDDVQEDDPSLEADNNIEGHFIAECEFCHDIFVSAVIESDQEIDHVSGICPLCGKEGNQYLKWVIVKKEAREEQLESQGGIRYESN